MRALIYTLLTATLFVISPVNAQTAKPICQNLNDPDGDGWGWENNASCRMPTNTSGVTNTVTSNNNNLTLSTLLGQCITELASQDNNTTTTAAASSSNCVDTAPVGDGWGWNGSTSCRVTASTQQASTQQPAQCTTPTNTNNSGSQGGQYGTGFTDYTNAQPTCQEAGDRILRLVREGMHESEALRIVGKPRHVEASTSSYNSGSLKWGYNSRSDSRPPLIYFNLGDRTVTSFLVDSSRC